MSSSALPPLGVRVAFAFPATFRPGWRADERRSAGVVSRHGNGTFAVEPDDGRTDGGGRPLGVIWLSVDGEWRLEPTGEPKISAA